MNDFLIPIVLVLIASVFQGTFAFGMKYSKPLPWEAWWLVHATVAMFLMPVLWAVIVVPDLFGTIGSASLQTLFLSMLFGFLWGIGGIMFGVSVPFCFLRKRDLKKPWYSGSAFLAGAFVFWENHAVIDKDTKIQRYGDKRHRPEGEWGAGGSFEK